MSQCGVGYLEGHLDLLEAALTEGNPPGQALLDRLPRDKEKNLRPESIPVFVAAINSGIGPEAALHRAFAEDIRILLQACENTWKLGNETEDLRASYQDAVAALTETICERDVHVVGAGRSALDNPASHLPANAKAADLIANIRFLIANLWAARKWLGEGNSSLQAYKMAIGLFSYELPGAVDEGKVLVQRDRERMRAGSTPAKKTEPVTARCKGRGWVRGPKGAPGRDWVLTGYNDPAYAPKSKGCVDCRK